MRMRIENKEQANINEKMFGIFLEDINYGIDGGLYADMIENRNFEALNSTGSKTQEYKHVLESKHAWDYYLNQGVETMVISEEGSLNEVNPHYILFQSEKEGGGLVNYAYNGLFLEKDMEYVVSFWARMIDTPKSIKICVVSSDRKTTYLEALEPIKVNNREWKKYTTTIHAHMKIENALFAVLVMDKGSIAFDQFSMIPKDAVLGIFRKDLFEVLKELKPGFVRFPGGCIVEGANLANRYDWKKSIGDIETRKNNWNRWAIHETNEKNGYISKFSHYNQTLGIGFYEYFLLSEALEAIPLPILNVGVACQFQSKEIVAINSEEFDEYIQDALDLIEFANGDIDTKWGSVRQKMGHEKPFGLTAIGIGNEQWETDEVDFFARYSAFESAIHEVYPEVQLISTAGADVTSHYYQKAWEFFRNRTEENSQFTFAVDEHYYMPPVWFKENDRFYDNYPRDGIKVFAGEYAAHEEERGNTWETALAEAAFLTGIERNSDIVEWASYAPLLARKGFAQWKPNLIWFDEQNIYLTPNYYVQQLFANYRGNKLVPITMDQDKSIYSVCTCKESACGSNYFIKVVNTGSVDKEITITLGDNKKTLHINECIVLSSDNLQAVNESEEMVVPVEGEAKIKDNTISLNAKSYSVNVLAIFA